MPSHGHSQDLPPNPTDLKAKPERQDEKWEHFHLIKCELSHVLIIFSLIVLCARRGTYEYAALEFVFGLRCGQ